MEKEKGGNGVRRIRERRRRVGIQVRKESTEVTTKGLNDGVRKGEERIGWDGIKEDWKREMKEVLREVKDELMEEMKGKGER